jgi:hypothetical protein
MPGLLLGYLQVGQSSLATRATSCDKKLVVWPQGSATVGVLVPVSAFGIAQSPTPTLLLHNATEEHLVLAKMFNDKQRNP